MSAGLERTGVGLTLAPSGPEAQPGGEGWRGRLPILFAALAPVPLLAHDVVVGGLTASLAGVLTTVLGILLFRRRVLAVFHLALLLNHLTILLLLGQFLRENGDPFSSGGDDRLFFAVSETLAIPWAEGDWSAIQFFMHYDSVGYIAFGALLHIVMTALGDVNPLVIRVLGSFAGASLAPAVFLIARDLFGRDDPRWLRWTALAVAVFPILTYYSAMGLRDVWITAASTWFVVAQLRARSRPLRWWAVSVLLGIGIFFLRPSSLAPLLAFVAVMQLGGNRNYFRMFAQWGALIAGGTLLFLAWSQLWRKLQALSLLYTELSMESAAVESIGVRLLQLSEPVGTIARFVYTVYIPVPPIKGTGPAELIPGIGSALWYLAIPLIAVGIAMAVRDRQTRLPGLASAAMILTLLVGVSFTSIDVRHKTPILPLALVFAVHALRLVPPAVLRTYGVLYGCFLGLLAGTYLLIR